jgi:hypothetical protein
MIFVSAQKPDDKTDWHCQLGRLPRGWEDRRVARSEVEGLG